MLEILVGLGVVIFAIILGGWIAQSKNPPSETPGNNNPDWSCSQLCVQLQARHSERCIAEADVRAAEDRAQSLSDQRNWFLAAAAVALASGYAALLTVLGAFSAPGFFAAAAGLLVLALGLEGAVIAADNDRQSKAAVARTCRQREAEAMQLLLEKCPNEASSCISMLQPC